MKTSCVRLYAAELRGIEARIVEVEVDIRIGLHAFVIVGLADKALNEARERVNAALGSVGVKPPHRENRKITVNLAPADAKKTGAHYDLAIALGYLRASGQMHTTNTSVDERRVLCVGELALDGRLRPVRGALSIADRAARAGFAALLLPAENAREARAIDGIEIVAVSHIRAAIDYIERGTKPEQGTNEAGVDGGVRQSRADGVSGSDAPDLAEIRGHQHAKRALTIAAAGGHHVLLHGPPGMGKSMLAQALPGILPPLTHDEAVEVTKVRSAAGLTLRGGGLAWERPVRAPHQSASLAALLGGGGDPTPGEISLAHRGVLFLDELPEFPRHVLDALRQPLESRTITLLRSRQRVAFPADLILIAAMNPCPCGFYGDERVACTCTAREVAHYVKKVSGPLLDRIDLVVRMGRVDAGKLQSPVDATKRESPSVRRLVIRARERQRERFAGVPHTFTNGDMTTRQVQQCVPLTDAARGFLRRADLHRVSPRGYYRLLKVARTIADLEEAPEVDETHLAEAYTYRMRDRFT